MAPGVDKIVYFIETIAFGVWKFALMSKFVSWIAIWFGESKLVRLLPNKQVFFVWFWKIVCEIDNDL